MSDRRKHTRISTDLAVRIKLQSYDEFVRQFATDISAGGLFIATNETYAVGQQLEIEFYVAEKNGYFFKVRGVVKRLHDSPPGVGVEFTAIEEQSQKMLDALMAHLSQG